MIFQRKSLTEFADEALMREVGKRNERAFAVLYDRYSPRMYRFFLRMLGGDTALAEDFTQDIFLKIIEKPQAFDPERNFRTWLYKVAYNLCKNEYRRNALTLPQLETWESPLPEALDRPQFEQCLKNAISALEETQRQCFVLRYQESLSISEIAQILDCPEGTVKSRIFYALRQVSASMAQWKNWQLEVPQL